MRGQTDALFPEHTRAIVGAGVVVLLVSLAVLNEVLTRYPGGSYLRPQVVDVLGARAIGH